LIALQGRKQAVSCALGLARMCSAEGELNIAERLRHGISVSDLEPERGADFIKRWQKRVAAVSSPVATVAAAHH